MHRIRIVRLLWVQLGLLSSRAFIYLGLNLRIRTISQIDNSVFLRRQSFERANIQTSVHNSTVSKFSNDLNVVETAINLLSDTFFCRTVVSKGNAKCMHFLILCILVPSALALKEICRCCLVKMYLIWLVQTLDGAVGTRAAWTNHNASCNYHSIELVLGALPHRVHSVAKHSSCCETKDMWMEKTSLYSSFPILNTRLPIMFLVGVLPFIHEAFLCIRMFTFFVFF